MNDELFTGKAVGYARYRPGYPAALIDALYSEFGFSAGCAVADIGAGTGIFSRLLAERGSQVICVEPNPDMLNSAREYLAGWPNCRFVAAPAEQTRLPERSVDFVTAAQAFHWFDRQVFRRECARILKPGGKAVLIWNDHDADSPLIAGVARINAALCPNFKGFSGGRAVEPEAYADFFKGGSCALRECRFEKAQTEAQFIGRLLSASYAPREGDGNYAPYIERLRALFDEHAQAERVVMPDISRAYVGEV